MRGLSSQCKRAVKGVRGQGRSEQSGQPYHIWRPSLTTGNATKVMKN